MIQFKSIVIESFNQDNEAHMLSLHQLWEVGFKNPHMEYKLVTDDWKRLGFQSDDPMRDFRGTGIFGLEQILFFAEKCPQKFEYILDLEKFRGEMYPFVVASFNVTMMLFELLGWGWKSKPGVSSSSNQYCYPSMVKILFPNNDTDYNQSKFALNIMFCIASIILDNKWSNMVASYLDFPIILKNTQTEFENIFTSEKKTLTDLLKILDNMNNNINF